MANKLKKSILIIMPFGGEDEKNKRRFMLKYKRLKYITENLNVGLVRKGQPDIRVQFSASVFLTNTGLISQRNLQAIKDADILFCLLSEANATVTYELAVRNLLRDELVIFVEGEPVKLLPFYLKEMAYIVPSDVLNNEVSKVIEEIVEDESIALSFDDNFPFPDQLSAVINEHDDGLRNQVKTALDTVLNARPPRQQYILDIMCEFDPEYTLSNDSTITYLPASMVRIRWNAKSNPDGGYRNEDQDGDAIVCDYNQYFLELYNYNIPMTGQGRRSTDFTLFKLLAQLKEKDIIEKDDLERFVEDQTRLSQDIIFGDSFGNAKIPLRLNGRHRLQEYCNKAFMPVLVTKRIVGQVDRPHTMYLLVVYIDVTGVPPSSQEGVVTISAAPPKATVLPRDSMNVDQPVGRGGGL